jgi:hypothetical protein
MTAIMSMRNPYGIRIRSLAGERQRNQSRRKAKEYTGQGRSPNTPEQDAELDRLAAEELGVLGCGVARRTVLQ